MPLCSTCKTHGAGPSVVVVGWQREILCSVCGEDLAADDTARAARDDARAGEALR